MCVERSRKVPQSLQLLINVDMCPEKFIYFSILWCNQDIPDWINM